MTRATTPIKPLKSFEPPVRLPLDYFTNEKNFPRAIAKMEGPGPTWLSGLISLPDKKGVDRLVANYVKIKPPMESYEAGLCVWNDDTKNFEHLKTIWKKSPKHQKSRRMPSGHPVLWKDASGKNWALFGNPLPTLRCPANFESWQDSSTWEKLRPQENLVSATDGKPVKPHSGSIAWNSFRNAW